MHNQSKFLQIINSLYVVEEKQKLHKIASDLFIDEKTLYYFRKKINEFAIDVVNANKNNNYNELLLLTKKYENG